VWGGWPIKPDVVFEGGIHADPAHEAARIVLRGRRAEGEAPLCDSVDCARGAVTAIALGDNSSGHSPVEVHPCLSGKLAAR